VEPLASFELLVVNRHCRTAPVFTSAVDPAGHLSHKGRVEGLNFTHELVSRQRDMTFRVFPGRYAIGKGLAATVPLEVNEVTITPEQKERSRRQVRRIEPTGIERIDKCTDVVVLLDIVQQHTCTSEYLGRTCNSEDPSDTVWGSR